MMALGSRLNMDDGPTMLRLLAAKRVAFLMAWHPTLGADAPISKVVSKDIARLIAREYLTLESQRFVHPWYKKHTVISSGEKTPFHALNVVIRPYRVKLSIARIYCVDAHLAECELLIQTPTMRLPFNNSLSQNPDGRYLLTTALLHGSSPFRTFCKTFDQYVVNEIETKPHLIGKINNRRELYCPLLKRHLNNETGEYDDKYPDTFSINPGAVTKRLVFTAQGEKMSLEEAEERGLLGQGAEVKIIFRPIEIWGSVFFGIRKVLHQMLIVREPRDMPMQACMFFEDSDGE